MIKIPSPTNSFQRQATAGHRGNRKTQPWPAGPRVQSRRKRHVGLPRGCVQALPRETPEPDTEA
jgi:hypothetical protein